MVINGRSDVLLFELILRLRLLRYNASLELDYSRRFYERRSLIRVFNIKGLFEYIIVRAKLKTKPF